MFNFQPAAGTLSFDDGQGYAELSVQLIDDEESELEKFFIVELLAPMGGGENLIYRLGGSYRLNRFKLLQG